MPKAIRGVLWRNGPGRLERGGVDYEHPFDGDGMVCRFEIAEGRVRADALERVAGSAI